MEVVLLKSCKKNILSNVERSTILAKKNFIRQLLCGEIRLYCAGLILRDDTFFKSP